MNTVKVSRHDLQKALILVVLPPSECETLSLPLLCVYMEVCFLFIFSLFLHLLPLRNFLSPNSVWRGGDGGNLVCSAPHGAFSVWREVRL